MERVTQRDVDAGYHPGSAAILTEAEKAARREVWWFRICPNFQISRAVQPIPFTALPTPLPTIPQSGHPPSLELVLVASYTVVGHRQTHPTTPRPRGKMARPASTSEQLASAIERDTGGCWAIGTFEAGAPMVVVR